MSSAAGAKKRPRDEEDASSSTTTTTATDHDGYLDDDEEDNNHDDYIREFSFEPEIIVPKRTVSANSLTCYAATSSSTASLKAAAAKAADEEKAKDLKRRSLKRPQRTQSSNDSNHQRMRFLRPNSLSLSLYKRNHPPGLAPPGQQQSKASTTTESIIPYTPPPSPTPSLAASLYPPPPPRPCRGQFLESGVCAGPSTSSGQHRDISLADGEPTGQQQKCLSNKSAPQSPRIFIVGEEGQEDEEEEVVGHRETSARRQVKQQRREASPAISVVESDPKCSATDSSSEGDGDTRARRRKRRKSRRLWCIDFGRRKNRPESSAEQVHHDIEAFYYVGIQHAQGFSFVCERCSFSLKSFSGFWAQREILLGSGKYF